MSKFWGVLKGFQSVFCGLWWQNGASESLFSDFRAFGGQFEAFRANFGGFRGFLVDFLWSVVAKWMLGRPFKRF